MVFSQLPIKDRIAGLVDMNIRQSKEFCSPNSQNMRAQYRAKHPTEILVLQCMDGRIHLPAATGIPMGILRPFKTLGGKFDLGWSYLSHVIQECVEYAIGNGEGCVVLITYHFSRGNKHRGCAGCNYDYALSVRQAKELKQQFERVYGPEGQIVYPLICGIETDTDSLILHGENGEELDVGGTYLMKKDETRHILQKMMGKMPERMLEDILPLLMGNMKHVADIRKRQRPIVEVEHREWILAVGRGLDWLYEPNMALIVGPYDIDLATAIKQAAGIIENNMSEGKIPDDEFLLLSSSHFSSRAGTSNTRAEQRSLTIGRFAESIIRENYPEFSKRMLIMHTATDLDTRLLHILKNEENKK